MSTLRISRLYDHATSVLRLYEYTKSTLNYYQDLAKDKPAANLARLELDGMVDKLRKIVRTAVINAGLELNAAVSKDGQFIYNILELENNDTLKWCKYTDMDLLKSVYEKLGFDTFVEHEYTLCHLTVLFNIIGSVDPLINVMKLAEEFGFTEYLTPEITELIHKVY